MPLFGDIFRTLGKFTIIPQSDQTHIDGVDCLHENDESEDYERKYEVIENLHGTKNNSNEGNLMTEDNQLEAETTETLDTVEMVETEKMVENMTTIKIELQTKEMHDIFSSSEVHETATQTATADYRIKNDTIKMVGSKSTINVIASTEKRQDIESRQSKVIDKFVTEIPRSSDASNRILAELRTLK